MPTRNQLPSKRATPEPWAIDNGLLPHEGKLQLRLRISEAAEPAKNKNRISRDHFCSPIVGEIMSLPDCLGSWTIRKIRISTVISTDDDAASWVASAKAGKELRGNITCMPSRLEAASFPRYQLSKPTHLLRTNFRNFSHMCRKSQVLIVLKVFPSRVSFSRRVAVGQFQFLYRC